MNAIPTQDFRYDPFAREVLLDPTPYYEVLRSQHPIYYVEKYDMFAFTRFQDIMDVLSVTEENVFIGSESTLPMPQMISHRNDGAPPRASIKPMAPGPMLPSPEYEEMRLAHIKPLRPKSVASMEDFVRGLVVERLAELLPQGRFEMMTEFGGMVAAGVTCQLFDLPLSETRAVLDAVNTLSSYSDDIEGVNTPGMFEQLRDYILPTVQRRRAAGADGSVPLIDGMIHHRTKSDDRALDDQEIVDQLVCVFVANTETPTKPTAQGLLALTLHPDQLAAVRSDLAGNIPIVTEEILRICTTAQWAIRTAHKDVTVAGQPIKAGQRVLVSMFSAARDEAEFENADAFIWNRPIKRSLVFGYGQHHCIGSHIARLQVRTMLREFLTHVSDFEFDMDAAVRGASYFHWGWASLPVIIKSHSL